MDDNSRQSKFDDVFSSDALGLLEMHEAPKQERRNEDWRLIDSFREITEFYENNQRIPELTDDIGEYRLASRLAAIKADPHKVKILLPYDLYNLMQAGETKSLSIEDILIDDPLGLLTSDAEADSIFYMSHVKPTDRLRPDYIAHRKVCEDFDMYEEAFRKVHDDLASGRRKLVEFKEPDLVEGSFYVLRGVVLYLEANGSTHQEINYSSGVRRRVDGRTRCIFDNGTESSMLFRSLGKAMRIDGFSISDVNVEDNKMPIIEPDDVQNGYIYVLRSLNRVAKVRQMKNLYKIGYCSSDVTSRLKKAIIEPTYLMSDVEVILTVRCYNLDVKYLESSIHRFFSGCNVLFEIKDDQGKMHYPREWFVAPLSIIEEAIRLIVDKEIDDYRYDPALRVIIKTSL